MSYLEIHNGTANTKVILGIFVSQYYFKVLKIWIRIIYHADIISLDTDLIFTLINLIFGFI